MLPGLGGQFEGERKEKTDAETFMRSRNRVCRLRHVQQLIVNEKTSTKPNENFICSIINAGEGRCIRYACITNVHDKPVREFQRRNVIASKFNLLENDNSGRV